MTAYPDPPAMPFDADAVGLLHGQIPPPPWTCPSCGLETRAIALTNEGGLLCPEEFQNARAAGRDPELVDAVLA